MPVPASLRIARLLLFAAAASSFAVAIAIAARASFVSPLLLLFGAPVLLFAVAHRAMPADVRRARLLATAGAATLAALAILTGFGAGDLSFPAAGIGVLAAWAAWLRPPRRRTVLLFVAYLLIGVIITVVRGAGVFLSPFLLTSALIWPATFFFLVPALAGLPIYAGLGAGLAFAAYSIRDRIPTLHAAIVIAIALVAGAIVVTVNVATAYAQPGSSARLELDAIALAALFIASAAATLGLLAMRRAPVLASCAVMAGAAILSVALISRPTVTCARNGVGTSPNGPWWLGPSTGPVSGSGGGSSDGRFTGVIQRGDGITIRYACDGESLITFVIERP